MPCLSDAIIWHISSYRLVGHIGQWKLSFCGVLTCLDNLARPKNDLAKTCWVVEERTWGSGNIFPSCECFLHITGVCIQIGIQTLKFHELEVWSLASDTSLEGSGNFRGWTLAVER